MDMHTNSNKKRKCNDGQGYDTQSLQIKYLEDKVASLEESKATNNKLHAAEKKILEMELAAVQKELSVIKTKSNNNNNYTIKCHH